MNNSDDLCAIGFKTIQNQPPLNDQTSGVWRNLWSGNAQLNMIGKCCRAALNPLHNVICEVHVAVVGNPKPNVEDVFPSPL
jgi:hypothetical protein